AVIAVCVSGMAIRSSHHFGADPGQIAGGGITIKSNGRGSVALIGDSQGAMYGDELASLARLHGFSLNILSARGTNELPHEFDTRWSAVVQFLAERRPDVVIQYCRERQPGRLSELARVHPFSRS